MAADPLLDRLEADGLTLRVLSRRRESAGALVFASDRPPLEALRTVTFDHPELLDGADLILNAVGLAAAYLAILNNVGRVVCRVLSQDARTALQEEGIDFSAGSTVKKLPERYAAPMAAYERRALGAITPQAFLEELKRIRDR